MTTACTTLFSNFRTYTNISIRATQTLTNTHMTSWVELHILTSFSLCVITLKLIVRAVKLGSLFRMAMTRDWDTSNPACIDKQEVISPCCVSIKKPSWVCVVDSSAHWHKIAAKYPKRSWRLDYIQLSWQTAAYHSIRGYPVIHYGA